jgi:hypothetical protein
MAAPAQPKNSRDRVANRSLNQMTKAAGMTVSRHVTTKISNAKTSSATAPPKNPITPTPGPIASRTRPTT